MIFDCDDSAPGQDAMPYLLRLKEINPAFKATLFSSPGLASEEYWDDHPDWIELAVHGWLHPDPYECANWTKERTLEAMANAPARFVRGWKSPGWQTSDGVYQALLEHNWWIADQHLEDHRRPPDLWTYFYEDSDDRIHTHSHNVCGNGLEETWGTLVEQVCEAKEFLWCSEALSLGAHTHDTGTRMVSR